VAVAAEVIAGLLIAMLLLATALTLFVGLMGALFSEGFERCPRCGHWTLGIAGTAHPGGCPGSLSEHLVHVVRAAFRHVHLRHH
jgi:hypothetical protein